ncbi:MAG TPA: hypothetical protein VJ935_01515 [Acidimicrobiia bacterium]|nr:hypothetical protein [Acidimicrobiia bacterium]
MKADYQLAALATSQAGFLGHDQVKRLSFSDEMIANRITNGTWTRVRNGLYKVGGIAGDHRGLLRGAMAILPNPTISHESAAEAYSMPYVARSRAVVTVHARTTHDFPGVTIHRSLDLANDHRQLVDTQFTTTPERTLNDLAAVLHPNALANVLEESLARKLVTMDGVARIFDEVARRGRTGSGAMRQLLNERVGSQLVTATNLRRSVLKFSKVAGCRDRSFSIRHPGIQASVSISPGRTYALDASVTVGAGIPGSPTFRKIETATTFPFCITGESFDLPGRTSPSAPRSSSLN